MKHPCDGCQGEDCIACSYWIENQRANEAMRDFGPDMDEDEIMDNLDSEDDGWDREDMDGDHDSAMASIGWGVDEDYRSDYFDDTPMGQAYADGEDQVF